MKPAVYGVACFLALAFSSECFGGMADARQKIEALLAQKEFSGVRFGISITEAGGENIFSFNDTACLIPASNQKLLTGACGLLQFGPCHRFTTRFYRQGPVENGALRGNLVVRGTGAIEFTARYTDDFDRKKQVLGKQLDDLADKIKSAGIRRIGNIVIDASAWTGMGCNAHYPSAGSVTFNENTVEIEVADKRIRTIPETLFHFELLPQAGGARQEKALKNGKPTDRIRINSAADSTNYWRIDQICAEDYYRLNIIHALARRGIALTGETGAPDAAEALLFELEGIPVSEYVYRMFNDSDNLRAELLFLNLGYSLHGKANYGSASAACKALLEKNGILPDSGAIADGSGLSPENSISAKSLTRLLLFMNAHTHREVFRNSLAVSGLTGTIQDKFSARELTGKIHAKSGTLDGALTLSGFVETAKGEAVFSFLANQVDDRKKIWALYEKMLLCLIKKGSSDFLYR